MGQGGYMLNDELRVGQIIYWTEEPLALLMKPKDAGRLWKVGLLVEKNFNKDCVIMNEKGDLIKCSRAMIIECPELESTT